MTITFDVPEEIAARLQTAWGDALPRVALEGLVAETYRAEKFTTGQVGRALGLSLNDANGFLKDRDIMPPLTVDDLRQDLADITAVTSRKAVAR